MLQANVSLTTSGEPGKWPHLTGPLAISGIREELGNIRSIYQYSTKAKVSLNSVQQKLIKSQMAPQGEIDWIITEHKKQKRTASQMRPFFPFCPIASLSHQSYVDCGWIGNCAG